MKVEIPLLPPKETNPNWRGHWAKKAKAVRTFKDAAYYCAVTLPRSPSMPYKKASLSITLVIPDKRYVRDEDNAIASIKPGVDGCKGVIIQDDDPDHLTIESIRYEFSDLRNCMTILEFTEIIG